jgi:Zn-finger nucleic acid-binding protein
MKKISYRFYDLELEICPGSDGFYLDAHEEERLVELLRQDKKADNRKTKAEDEWDHLITRMKSKAFFSRVKSFFNR